MSACAVLRAFHATQTENGDYSALNLADQIRPGLLAVPVV